MPKAYSYVRFSTPEQREGDSERRQIALAEAYAKEHGLEMDRKTRFQDLGVSAFRGNNVKKGALGAFLEAVSAGSIEQGSYLLVEDLDRISRRVPRLALRALEDIVDAGIILVTLSDKKVWTPEGLNGMDLIFSLLKFFRGNEESVMKASRLRAVWARKRELAATGELKLVTRRLPGWIKVDEKSGGLRAEPEKVKIIRRIFRAFLEGVSPQRIAQELNKEKVPVFGGGGRRSNKPRWRSSYVAKILDNPAVTGAFVPHEMKEGKDEKLRRQPVPGLAVPDYYPPVVPQEQYEAVRLVRSVPAARGRHAVGPLLNIFGGLARCPLCEGTMTRINKGKPPKGGAYLICSKAKDAAGCKYKTVRYEGVERAFLENIEEVIGMAPAGDSSEDLDSRLAAKEAELSATGTALENILDAIERRPSPALDTRRAALEGQLSALEDEIVNLRGRIGEEWDALVQDRLNRLEEEAKAKEPNRTAINHLLRQLLQSVTVDYRQGRLVMAWRQGGESTLNYSWPDRKAGKRSK